MKKLFLTAMLAALATASWSAIVINEFAYDDAGATDDFEYVELYNTGATAVDISGYKLESWSATTATPAGAADFTLTVGAGVSIPANGYYVFGTASVVAVVPGGVPTQTFANTTLQNDQEALVLRDASNTILDSVAYETNKGFAFPAGIGEGGGIWSNFIMIENPGLNNPVVDTNKDNATYGYARHSDGQDTNNNDADFGNSTCTPGAANNSKGNVTLPFSTDFTGTEGSYLTELPGDYWSFTRQDPGVVDTLDTTNGGNQNPRVIPASPGGGQVGMFWDESGGGNGGFLNLTAPVADVELEFYVYLTKPTLTASGTGADALQWSFPVVRGRSDPTPYNHETANGDYGVRLKYRLGGGNGVASLTVEERKNGAHTALIPAVNIAADGWQRILFSVKGSSVRLVYGGTYGTNQNTGSVYYGTTTISQAGGVAFGYREYNAWPGTLNANPPLVIDNLAVRAPTMPNADVSDWTIY